MAAHTILKDVSIAYVDRYRRYEQAVARGDLDRADEAFSQIQDIENSVTVIEHNRSWRDARKRA